jgi:hypothetical protein
MHRDNNLIYKMDIRNFTSIDFANNRAGDLRKI